MKLSTLKGNGTSIALHQSNVSIKWRNFSRKAKCKQNATENIFFPNNIFINNDNVTCIQHNLKNNCRCRKQLKVVLDQYVHAWR